MPPQPPDLYATLGVGRHATTDEVEAAFAAWQARADGGEAFADEVWQRVRYAHEVLSNPQRRSLYESLVAETAATGLDLTLTVSATQLPLRDTPQLVYALVTLGAREATAARRPLALGLVIDRSTSMRGERLEKVVAAVELLLDRLAPDDALTVVSFSDRAEVVLPVAVLGLSHAPDVGHADHDTAAAWRDPHRRLRALTASGGTEIYQGLRAGLDELSRLSSDGRTTHLILLTDGHTYGDADHCLRLATDAAARGIGITAFGLGADWNDAFLDDLVAPSGGQSHYVETPGDVLPHLEKRLAGLGDSHARGIALRHAWPSQLTLRAGFKLSPFPQPLTPEANPIPVGDLEGRAPVTLLLEFVVAPLSVPARFRLPIELRYSRPDGGEASLSRAAQLLAQGEASDTAPPAALIEAARRLNLYRMQEKAWEEAQSGQLDTAAARMRRLTARYLETGDLRLAQQAQLEAQRLGHLGTMSAEGRKVLKYGTRSLLGQLPEEEQR